MAAPAPSPATYIGPALCSSQAHTATIRTVPEYPAEPPPCKSGEATGYSHSCDASVTSPRNRAHRRKRLPILRLVRLHVMPLRNRQFRHHLKPLPHLHRLHRDRPNDSIGVSRTAAPSSTIGNTAAPGSSRPKSPGATAASPIPSFVPLATASASSSSAASQDLSERTPAGDQCSAANARTPCIPTSRYCSFPELRAQPQQQRPNRHPIRRRHRIVRPILHPA